MWKEKFFDHPPVSSCIHRDSALVFLKKIRTNDPDRWNWAPNGNTLTMERGLVKLTWNFSTPVAHILFVDTAGKVKGEMERPLLKYASTANARCSLVQSMIGTGCGGTKIEDLPSRTQPLPAPYLHPLPFGEFVKKVSFSAAPCSTIRIQHIIQSYQSKLLTGFLYSWISLISQYSDEYSPWILTNLLINLNLNVHK